MATVPIEIVLQDAETPVDPTPTPESGEETNIVVPNTGTISNDGSSNGGIGSTISIILPIVIAVLALGAMVALLIHRQQKRKSNVNANMSKKEKFFVATSGTIAILAATVLVGNLVIPATNAATSVAPGTAELETEDKITIIATREQDSDEAVVATVKNTSYATANLDFGYKVTASMAEGLDSANLYLDGDETSEYYIAPLEDGILTDNTWGYTLEEPSEDATYLPIPITNDPTTIVKGSGEIEDEAVDIYYTIKVDKSLPAGTYTGELEYTIAPAVEYMQDFAAMTEAERIATLANMPEGEQYILKDSRDEKPYYISKLADGNVWMTQNLDFDIAKGGADIDSTNTDVSEDWEDGGSLANTLDDIASWNASDVKPYSYDPENLYWNGIIIADATTCAQYGGRWYDPGYTSPYCKGANPTTSTGNEHYHIGNYYNWTAAVAMSSSNDISANTDVDQSICPAGWMLPKSGAELTGSGSFQYLVDQAGLSAGVNGNIHIAPNWFVYGGYLYDRTLTDMGVRGRYYSSVAGTGSDTDAYFFHISATYSDPNVTFSNRNLGYFIRCIAR